MKGRIIVSSVIGIASAIICWIIHLKPHAVDFGWALGAAHDLVAGRDPYSAPISGSIPYPLPATVFAFPLLWLRTNPNLAGALFFGASSALLAFGLTRGGYTRLLVFLAFPYWMAMITVQWSPLVMAGALLPWLFPAVLAKPQIGIPIALTYWNWTGIVGCLVLTAASLLVMPNWPLRWVSQISGFQNYIPMLVLPGPALLLALWVGADPDAHLLLLASLTPQHWFYDSFTLWLIPKSSSEILATACLSWGAVLWWPLNFATRYSPKVGSLAVVWMYLPMLALLLLRATLLGNSQREKAVWQSPPGSFRLTSLGRADHAPWSRA
jgi:hypothetical protein